MVDLSKFRAFGDPDDTSPPTAADKRKQAQAERIAEWVRRMHFHRITEGESVGCYSGHTHDDDEPGHTHEPRHAVPLRADGGYMETLGPALAERPPLRPETVATVAAIFRNAEKNKRPSDIMRWRLGLFCGHVIERQAHVSNQSYTSWHGACPECRKDPVTVVAAKPLGLVEEPRTDPAPTPPPASPGTLRKRLSRAEAEVARLRRELAAAKQAES